MAYGDGLQKLSPCDGAPVLALLREGMTAPPRALLDAGCGRGERLADCILALPGCALCGIDSDAANAEAARQRCPGSEIVTGDVCALPWPDARFDAALCECTLSLLNDPAHCLAELSRVLRPGGALLLSDLCTAGEKPVRERLSPDGPVRCLASRGWIELAAEAAGFSILRFRDCREEYLTMAAQMLFDGGDCRLGPGAFAALRQRRAGYGMWCLKKGGAP